eukprot:TRINITY_DN5156_c0_g1_i1.p1 TRINITY_DN5156_c0_g1~~TRINITY_DN5156_c0_g1_i1.p1  ORF type:complete len:279 (-),score=64.68 TRINITY_DN5156_c0_g1_i1:360-1196(-)
MMDCINLRIGRANGGPDNGGSLAEGKEDPMATYIKAAIDEKLRHVLSDVRTVLDSELQALRDEMTSLVNLSVAKSEQASIGLSHAMEELLQLRGHVSPVSQKPVAHADAVKESTQDIERRLQELELQIARQEAHAFRVPDDPPPKQGPPVATSASRASPPAPPPLSSGSASPSPEIMHGKLDGIAKRVEEIISEIGGRARVTDLDKLKQEVLSVNTTLNLHASADGRLLDMVSLMDRRLVDLEVLTTVREAPSPHPPTVREAPSPRSPDVELPTAQVE